MRPTENNGIVFENYLEARVAAHFLWQSDSPHLARVIEPVGIETHLNGREFLGLVVLDIRGKLPIAEFTIEDKGHVLNAIGRLAKVSERPLLGVPMTRAEYVGKMMRSWRTGMFEQIDRSKAAYEAHQRERQAASEAGQRLLREIRGF